MKTIEYANEIDRSGWGRGPWDDEPDRVQWETEAGLPGLAVRNHRGAWCGYAAVPAGHRFHGLDFSDISIGEHPHGGLTYAAACQERICHEIEPGDADGVWWFGFDCMHLDDLVPAYAAMFTKSPHDIYCQLSYVKGQVELLARNLI